MIRTCDNHISKAHYHNLYILEQPSSLGTSRRRPSWPRSRLRLSLLLVLLPKYIPCLSWPPSILLFAPADWVSHLTPSLLSERLRTFIQVNNTTALHDTQGHTYIHHISITILLLFYTYSIFLGRPAGSDPSHLTQIVPLSHDSVLFFGKMKRWISVQICRRLSKHFRCKPVMKKLELWNIVRLSF